MTKSCATLCGASSQLPKFRRNNIVTLNRPEDLQGTVASLRMCQNAGWNFGFAFRTVVDFLLANISFCPDFHWTPIAFCMLWERICIYIYIYIYIYIFPCVKVAWAWTWQLSSTQCVSLERVELFLYVTCVTLRSAVQ